jgi:hypothetical protein
VPFFLELFCEAPRARASVLREEFQKKEFQFLKDSFCFLSVPLRAANKRLEQIPIQRIHAEADVERGDERVQLAISEWRGGHNLKSNSGEGNLMSSQYGQPLSRAICTANARFLSA